MRKVVGFIAVGFIFTACGQKQKNPADGYILSADAAEQALVKPTRWCSEKADKNGSVGTHRFLAGGKGFVGTWNSGANTKDEQPMQWRVSADELIRYLPATYNPSTVRTMVRFGEKDGREFVTLVGGSSGRETYINCSTSAP